MARALLAFTQKLDLLRQNLHTIMHLSSAFPGKGTPGLPGGNQLKLKKSAPPAPGSFWSSGPFSCPRIGDIFKRQWVATIVSVNMRLC